MPCPVKHSSRVSMTSLARRGQHVYTQYRPMNVASYKSILKIIFPVSVGLKSVVLRPLDGVD